MVSTLITPPSYQAPELYDIEGVKADYDRLISDAGKDAESYKQSKLWGGRLSDKHAVVYQGLLDKKAGLKAELLSKVSEYESLNRQLLTDSKDFKFRSKMNTQFR